MLQVLIISHVRSLRS